MGAADDDIGTVGSINSCLPCTLITLEEDAGIAARRLAAEGGGHIIDATCRPVGAAVGPCRQCLAVAGIFRGGVLEDVPADAAVLHTGSKVVVVAVRLHHHLQTDAHSVGPRCVVGGHCRGDGTDGADVIDIVLGKAEASAEHQLGIVGSNLGVVATVDVVRHHGAGHAVALCLTHVVGVGHGLMVINVLALCLCVIFLVRQLQELRAARLYTQVYIAIDVGIAVQRCPVVGQLSLAHVVAGEHEGEGLVVLHRCHLRCAETSAPGILIVASGGYGDGDGLVAGDIGRILRPHTARTDNAQHQHREPLKISPQPRAPMPCRLHCGSHALPC